MNTYMYCKHTIEKIFNSLAEYYRVLSPSAAVDFKRIHKKRIKKWFKCVQRSS